MRDRICVAIERNAKSSATISVASYHCKTTGRRIVVNNSSSPYSPYSGGDLKQISRDVVRLPIGEIRTDKDMRWVGNCPTCEGQLYMFAKEANNLAGKKIHCIICDTRFKVRAEDDGNSTIDSDNERNKSKDKINKKENEEEDTEIVQASDDNNNNNDDENEGEDAADAGEDISGNDDNDNDNDDDSSGENPVEENTPPAVPGAEVTAPGAAVPNAAPPVAEENPNPTPAPGSETTDVSSEGEENPDDTGEGNNDNNDNDDEDDDSEIVSANSKKFVINCFTRAGDLSNKVLQFIPVSSRRGLITADDAPIITLDADKAGDNKKLFDDPETLTKAVKAIIDQEEKITPESFASLGGRAVKFTVPVADAIKQRIEAGITSVTKSLDKRKNKLIKEMQACLSTASLIINKGVDRELPNPLRDSLVASLHKFNITSADMLVDQAFIEAAEPYIKAVLAKANDLYSQPLTTRNEIARFVERTPYATTANTGGNEHSKKFGLGNVLVNTAGFKEEEPDPPVREVTAGAVNSRVQDYRQLLRK